MAETKKRRAKGEGTIRYVDDKKLWEGRLTVGVDPGTGKSIRKSIYGKTQKEVRRKMTAARSALDNNDYHDPSKLTVGQWLDIWQQDYLGRVKPSTAELYRNQVRLYIMPALGATKLEELDADTIQRFYNRLGKKRGSKPGLSPKSIKNVHGILHKALQQAVRSKKIHSNPADSCELPRVEKPDVKPLDEEATVRFIQTIRGHYYSCLLS